MRRAATVDDNVRDITVAIWRDHSRPPPAT
jgi:hypothetical protein